MFRKALFILFIFIIVASATLYLRYLTAPRYSFLKAKNAVVDKDLKTFLKFTAIEELAASIVFIIKENISYLPAGTISRETEEALDKDEGRLKKIIKKDIEEYVSGRESRKSTNLFYPYFDRDSFFKGILYEKERNDRVIIGVRFLVKEKNTQIICDFIMERKGLFWVMRGIEGVWEARRRLFKEFRE
ncbi:MAG: hypothetical protein GF375_03930 [Candidatus Omnitrophica bacterium]|nr:hypothetical protein [Candidatus Omnitrophota bacterium]MBD3269206.1 hypothetical protein [Candidatus Omnitrophota bacterium]